MISNFKTPVILLLLSFFYSQIFALFKWQHWPIFEGSAILEGVAILAQLFTCIWLVVLVVKIPKA